MWRDRAYGDMWSYMLLAEGLLDAVGEFDVKTYDLAALIPIVEEAGGAFTSATGEPGPANGSSLASNGLLHPALLEALVQLLVPLGDPFRLTRRDHAVAGLQGRVDGVDVQSAAPALERLEADRLHAHDVRVPLEFERLDGELVVAHDVEDAVERVGLASDGVDVPVAASCRAARASA